MNRWRWLAAGLLAMVPLLVVLVLLGGVIVDATRLAAAIAALMLVLAGVGAATILLWARARQWKARSVAEGEAVNLGRTARAASLALVDTDAAHAIRAALSFADLPHHVVAAFGMATRSPFAREQLAGVATAWQHDYRSLTAAVQGEVTGDLLLRSADPLALLMLARLIDSQRLDESDPVVAGELFAAVARHPRNTELSRTARQLLIERLLLSGRIDLARTAIEQLPGGTLVDRLFALDAINPFTAGESPEEGARERWLAGFNAIYRRVGLDVLTVEPGTDAPFDRLRSSGDRSPIDGPLISIVMTCYRPERAALLTAVSSVLAQSWRNWELLLVDDASPEEYQPMISEVAGLDPRIRLIRSEVNGGTYLRRNDALAQARGELVTMHDSDDWMHPRRLEVQARHLLARPALLANVSRSARVTPDLRFAQPRGTMLRLTETSLLFRRREVLERIGYFDPVRKGADSVYRRRLEAELGRPVPIVDVEAPLTLARFAPSSLSAGELRDGWTHPARVAYSSAAAHWVATGGRRLEHPLVCRPYPAPTVLGGETQDLHLDVVYVLDPRDDPRRTRENARFDRELVATASRMRVGVRRSESLVMPWVQQPTRGALQELINAGRVREVLADERVTARLAIVLDEACLIGVAGDAVPLSAERVVVVERERPDGSRGVRWNRTSTQAGAKRLFGDVPIEFIRLEQLVSLQHA